jgi:uncharacterized coiled-coil protein SlyX
MVFTMDSQTNADRELLEVVDECRRLTDRTQRRLQVLVGKLTQAIKDVTRGKRPRPSGPTNAFLETQANRVLSDSNVLLEKMVDLVIRFDHGEYVLDELKAHRQTLLDTIGRIDSLNTIVDAGGLS